MPRIFGTAVVCRTNEDCSMFFFSRAGRKQSINPSPVFRLACLVRVGLLGEWSLYAHYDISVYLSFPAFPPLPSPPLPPPPPRRRAGYQDSPIFCELIEKLTSMGFMTDKLAMPDARYTPGKSQTFMGICKLPGQGRLHRRLDIKLYPRCVWW